MNRMIKLFFSSTFHIFSTYSQSFSTLQAMGCTNCFRPKYRGYRKMIGGRENSRNGREKMQYYEKGHYRAAAQMTAYTSSDGRVQSNPGMNLNWQQPRLAARRVVHQTQFRLQSGGHVEKLRELLFAGGSGGALTLHQTLAKAFLSNLALKTGSENHHYAMVQPSIICSWRFVLAYKISVILWSLFWKWEPAG